MFLSPENWANIQCFTASPLGNFCWTRKWKQLRGFKKHKIFENAVTRIRVASHESWMDWPQLISLAICRQPVHFSKFARVGRVGNDGVSEARASSAGHLATHLHTLSIVSPFPPQLVTLFVSWISKSNLSIFPNLCRVELSRLCYGISQIYFSHIWQVCIKTSIVLEVKVHFLWRYKTFSGKLGVCSALHVFTLVPCASQQHCAGVQPLPLQLPSCWHPFHLSSDAHQNQNHQNRS